MKIAMKNLTPDNCNWKLPSQGCQGSSKSRRFGCSRASTTVFPRLSSAIWVKVSIKVCLAENIFLRLTQMPTLEPDMCVNVLDRFSFNWRTSSLGSDVESLWFEARCLSAEARCLSATSSSILPASSDVSPTFIIGNRNCPMLKRTRARTRKSWLHEQRDCFCTKTALNM